jgi:hypothetical protein
MMFQAMTDQLTDFRSNKYKPFAPNSISMEAYEQWQKEYTWDALQDQRYGQSFCRQFAVEDYRLFYERDWVKSDSIIRSEYLERP